jgi:NAD(P)H-hydrate repair Nnr-like enzyme with NAD(P)H-hydrate dehydratase domain
MNYDFWQQQTAGTSLFPDVEWNKPERRDQAGRLGIIGGNKLGFSAAAESYQTALETGAGEVRVLLPDVLKRSVPAAMTDVLFAPTNPSGSLAAEAANDVRALGDWATGILCCGDAGKNSQTAVVYEDFITHYHRPIVLTRDAIDLVQNSFSRLLDNPNVVFVASFAQLQRMFKEVYYPKVLTFSVQLAQLVEIVHKFTITYPVTIVVLHASHLIIARGGQVVTQAWDEPMRIWRGQTATRAATYLLWSPEAPLAAIASSIA